MCLQIGEDAQWDYVFASKSKFSPTNEYSFDPRMSENFRLAHLRHAGITSGNIRTQMRELHTQPRHPTEHQVQAYEKAIQHSSPMTASFSCPAGMPVLFVHGHRGSAPQVSSFAAHSAASRRGTLFAKLGPAVQLSWFSIDFHEASTAFHAGLMRAQAAYLNDAVGAIRQRYSRSMCAPVTADGHPPPVQLIAHSMGGLLARLAVLLPNHEPGSFVSVLALNSPQQAHPVDTDASAAALYRHINHVWHASATNSAPAHLAHLSSMFIASVTSGYSDPLVRPDLTRLDGLLPPSRSLWAPLDAIPGAWCSSGHQNIVACGPFLSRVVRALHRAAAVTAAGGNTTAEATAELWHDALIVPTGVAPPVRVASASQQLQAEQQELSDWKNAFSLGIAPAWLALRTKLSDGVYLTSAVSNRILAVTAEGLDLSGALSMGPGQAQGERHIVGRAEGEGPPASDTTAPAGDVAAHSTLRVCVRTPASVLPALGKRELLVTVVSNQPPPCAIRGGACVLGPGAALSMAEHSAVRWESGGLGLLQDNSLLPDRQYPLHAQGAMARLKASFRAGEGEHTGGPAAPEQLLLSDGVALEEGELSRHALAASLPYSFSAWSARGRLPPPPLSLKAPDICLEWSQRDTLADSTWLYMHVAVAPRASSGVQALQAPQHQVHNFQLLRHWSRLLNPAAWMAWLVTGDAVFTSVTWRMPVGSPPLTWLGLRGAGQLVQLHPFLGYQVSVTSSKCGTHQAPPATLASQTPALWHAVAFGDAAAGPKALWHAAPIVAHSSGADWDRKDSGLVALVAQELAALLLGWPRQDAQSLAAAQLMGRNRLGGAGAPTITNHWLKVTHFPNTSAVPALSLLSDPRCAREVQLSAAPSSILLTWLPQRLPWLLCTLCSVIMLHLALAQGLWVTRRIAWKCGKRLWRARLWEYACHSSMGGQGAFPQPQLPQYARFPSLAHVQRHLWLPLLLLSVCLAAASASLRAALHPPLDWQLGTPHPGLGTPIEWRPMTLQEHLALHVLSIVLVAAYCRLLSGISRVFGWGSRGAALLRSAATGMLQYAFRKRWLHPCITHRCCLAASPATGFLDVAYRKRTSSHSVTGDDDGGLQLPPLQSLSGHSTIDAPHAASAGCLSVWDVLVRWAAPAAGDPFQGSDHGSALSGSSASQTGAEFGAQYVVSPPRVTPHLHEGARGAGEGDGDAQGVMLGLRAAARLDLRRGMQEPQDSMGLQLGAELSLGFDSDSTEGAQSPAALHSIAGRPVSPVSPQRPPMAIFKVGIAAPAPPQQQVRNGHGRIFVQLPPQAEEPPSAVGTSSSVRANLQPVPTMPPLHVRTLSSSAFVSNEGPHTPSLVRSHSLGGLSAALGGGISPLHSSLALSSISLASKSVQRAATGLRSLTLGVTMPRTESGLLSPSFSSARGIGVGPFDTPPSPLGRAGPTSARLPQSGGTEQMPNSGSSTLVREGHARRWGSRSSAELASALAETAAADCAPGGVEVQDVHSNRGSTYTPPAMEVVHTESYSSTGSGTGLPPPMSVAAAAALSFHSRAAAAAEEEAGTGGGGDSMGKLSSISRALLSSNAASVYNSRGGSSTKSGEGGGSDEPPPMDPPLPAGDTSALLLGMEDCAAQDAIGQEMAALWAVQDAQALNSAIRALHWLLHAPAMLVLHALLRCLPASSTCLPLLRRWDALAQQPGPWLLPVPALEQGTAEAAQQPSPSGMPPDMQPTMDTEAHQNGHDNCPRRRLAHDVSAVAHVSHSAQGQPQASTSARRACYSVLVTAAVAVQRVLKLPARALAFLRAISQPQAALLLLLLASASAWVALVSIALVMPWLVVAGAFTGLLLQTLLAAATLPPAALLHRATQAQAAAGSASASATLARGGRTRSDSVADADAALQHFAMGAAVAGEAALNETRHQEGIVLLYLLLLLSKATSVMYTAEATLQLRHPFHRDVLLALPMALELFAARAGKPLSNSAQLLGQVCLLAAFALVSQGFMYSIAPAVAIHAAMSLCARVHHALAHTTPGKVGTALYRRLEFLLASLPGQVLACSSCRWSRPRHPQSSTTHA